VAPFHAARARLSGPLALALALVLAVTGCGPRGDVVLVGAFLSLSGVDSTFGTDTRAGIDMALAEVNAAGGVHGKRVKVRYEDDKSLPSEAANKVRQLIDRDKVIAILGEVASSRSLVGGLIANTRKVPMISPSSTAVRVTKYREYVFRTCFTDAQQGAVAAHFVHDTLKRERVGIFYVAQDNYSSGLAASFRANLAKLGGTVVLDKGYPKGETNFTTFLEAFKAAKPDVIFVPNYYNDMVQIARQASQLGIPGSIFVGGDGWDSDVLTTGAGEELEGAFFTNSYAPDEPRSPSRAFLAAYEARYGRVPSSMAAQGYDAARVLFDAIRRAKVPTPDGVKTAISETRDFVGATGTITIDPEHNANKPVVIVQVKDKKLTYFTELLAP
jgi:branched-chain amino acid transport system substrate-binding protein